jgi:site-specific DNA-methyltransferase (cytosine-N4-specific)
MSYQILTGDTRDVLPTLPDASVQCCVTSPPYFGLRQYLPNAVQLCADLSEEERLKILDELKSLGIDPIMV